MIPSNPLCPKCGGKTKYVHGSACPLFQCKRKACRALVTRDGKLVSSDK